MRPLPRLCTSGTVPGASHGPRLNFARGYYRYGAVPASPMSQTAEGEGFKCDAGLCTPGLTSSCQDVFGHPLWG